MNQFKLQHEFTDKLVTQFRKRMEALQIKRGSKKYMDAQAEFFTGAVVALDLLHDNTESCVSPNIMFSIMRGDEIKLFSELTK